MATEYNYERTGNDLVDRIVALIPEHPEIIDLDSPWDLFKCGLKCDDLQPSLAQAGAALSKAKFVFQNENQ